MNSSTTKKPATIQDVAQAVGITPASVSRALNGKDRISPATREAVLRAARELGYEPDVFAQRLRKPGSNSIGLFCHDLDVGVGTRKINRIQQLLLERGFEVPIHACGFYGGTTDMQIGLIGNLRRQRPRAIVCAVGGLHSDVLAELERFQTDGGIVVCYDHPAEVNCDQVVFDREDNTYQAARHLLELGHRDIGLYMHGAPAFSWYKPHEEPRHLGFCRALREFQVPVREEWLLDGGLNEQGGADLAERFVAMKRRPGGLCMVNDSSALAFISRVLDAGLRVPQDISVVGHDNLPVSAYGAIPITTVSHPVDSIAQQVVELLSSRLEGSYAGPPRRVTVRGELIVRQSTAAPKGE